MTLTGVLASIDAYYTAKVTRFGATAAGADWSCAATQELRFAQLLRLIDHPGPITLDDIGCGYGALRSFLAATRPDIDVDYVGVDLSAAMIRRARRRWRGVANTRFLVGQSSGRLTDYAVASGIFNVRLEQTDNAWCDFIRHTLRQMHEAAHRGFAVNFMYATPADSVRAAGLYVTSPEPWVRFCRRALRARVEIRCGYGMPEFTLLARRPACASASRER